MRSFNQKTMTYAVTVILSGSTALAVDPEIPVAYGGGAGGPRAAGITAVTAAVHPRSLNGGNILGTTLRFEQIRAAYISLALRSLICITWGMSSGSRHSASFPVGQRKYAISPTGKSPTVVSESDPILQSASFRQLFT